VISDLAILKSPNLKITNLKSFMPSIASMIFM